MCETRISPSEVMDIDVVSHSSTVCKTQQMCSFGGGIIVLVLFKRSSIMIKFVHDST